MFKVERKVEKDERKDPSVLEGEKDADCLARNGRLLRRED
jgi:hypothetical protein